MPTLTQIKDAIDTFITNRWSTIIARQENFRTNVGRYWQGLPTHTVCPTHTNSTDDSRVGDRLGESPDDQGAFSTWLNVFPEWEVQLLPACIRVDVYNGPQGHGWVLTADVYHAGNLWRRSINVGPDGWRTQAWHQPGPPP